MFVIDHCLQEATLARASKASTSSKSSKRIAKKTPAGTTGAGKFKQLAKFAKPLQQSTAKVPSHLGGIHLNQKWIYRKTNYNIEPGAYNTPKAKEKYKELLARKKAELQEARRLWLEYQENKASKSEASLEEPAAQPESTSLDDEKELAAQLGLMSLHGEPPRADISTDFESLIVQINNLKVK